MYLRPKNFLLGSGLAFSLKEDPVRCAKVCDESWVILLYLLGLHWHPVESYRKFQPGSIFVEFIVNIYAFAPSHNSISKFQKNLVAPVGNKCAKKPIFSVKWLWPKLLYASDAVSYLHYCNAQHAHLGRHRVIISKQVYITKQIYL